MAHTDVLNPVSKWMDDIQDDPSPDYGFSAKRPDLRVRIKPLAGKPDSREVSNAGRTLSLSWLNRSYKCIQRVMQFAAQHEDGYFTIVDRDAGPHGRHYVGRIEGDLEPIQNGNDSYDLRNVTFVEYPGAPMLQYPNDWNRDAVYVNVKTDAGKVNPAFGGIWTAGIFAADGRNFATLTSAGVAGDWIQLQARHYGFALDMLTGRGYGKVQVYLDGVLLTPIDGDGNALSQTIDLYVGADDAITTVLFKEDVPIELHRVKVVVLGTKNAASTGTAATWVRQRIMR